MPTNLAASWRETHRLYLTLAYLTLPKPYQWHHYNGPTAFRGEATRAWWRYWRLAHEADQQAWALELLAS